jgi:hypothetical protein
MVCRPCADGRHDRCDDVTHERRSCPCQHKPSTAPASTTDASATVNRQRGATHEHAPNGITSWEPVTSSLDKRHPVIVAASRCTVCELRLYRIEIRSHGDHGGDPLEASPWWATR